MSILNMKCSALRGTFDDAIIIGGSSFEHLESNLNMCSGGSSGSLPAAVLDSFDTAWSITRAVCPSYFR